jgi:glycosyltransferase involved in cell wall biosynthesis
LIASGDHHALSAALEEILVDPALASQLGSAGKTRVSNGYSLSAVVENYLELYRRTLSIDSAAG